MKTPILTAIGETDLEATIHLNAALLANDRVKYAFSLLQMALAHAQHPEQASPALKQKRVACGGAAVSMPGMIETVLEAPRYLAWVKELFWGSDGIAHPLV
jgi:hypothetical protein